MKTPYVPPASVMVDRDLTVENNTNQHLVEKALHRKYSLYPIPCESAETNRRYKIVAPTASNKSAYLILPV